MEIVGKHATWKIPNIYEDDENSYQFYYNTEIKNSIPDTVVKI